MRRVLRTTLTAALILAVNAGDSSCENTTRSAAYDCHVDTRGLCNENGLVVDVVTNWCSDPPQRQAFTVWIEARRGPGDEWQRVGRTVTASAFPDARV